MLKNRVFKNNCLRCGHIWLPRGERSFVCPKCKSYKWDISPNEVKE